MRVAFDGSLIKPQENTGVENCILQLVQALGRCPELDVVVYVRQDVDCLEERENVHVKRLVPAGLGRVGRILWQQTALPRLAQRDGAELLHAPGYVAPLRCGIPVVLTAYDTMALTDPALCRPLNRWHYRRVMPRSLREAAAVIVPSLKVRQDVVREIGIPEDKIHVVPPGVDEAFESLDRTEVQRAREDYHLNGRALLFVGNLERNKNPLSLVRTVDLLKKAEDFSVRLILAGRKGRAFKEVARMVCQNKLYANVSWVGYVPREELVRLYNVADVFLFPSLHEGFGLPPLEAMACGCPVVCSNRAPFEEVLGAAACLVDPLCPEEIVGAIQRLGNDSDWRNEKIRLGRQRVSQYSWPMAGQRTVEVYRSVVEKGGR